jgi:hypothetical protein
VNENEGHVDWIMSLSSASCMRLTRSTSLSLDSSSVHSSSSLFILVHEGRTNDRPRYLLNKHLKRFKDSTKVIYPLHNNPNIANVCLASKMKGMWMRPVSGKPCLECQVKQKNALRCIACLENVELFDDGRELEFGILIWPRKQYVVGKRNLEQNS